MDWTSPANWAFVWKSALLITVGVLLLRTSGRKSISQMTIAQTVVMISIGSIIIQPIIETSVWKTIGASTIFILFLILMEFLELKFNWFEKFLSGKSIVVIEDGQLLHTNMKKIRLSVDALEMRLRQLGISSIQDIKTATIEVNGQLGFELKRHARPVTIGDLEQLFGELLKQQSTQPKSNLFEEVVDGHHHSPPRDNLQ